MFPGVSVFGAGMAAGTYGNGAMGQINKLSDRKVQSIKLPGMYADGGGLYLQVTAGKTCIAKSWIFRYATPSGDRYMGLGSLNTIGLAKAREKARQARELRLEGKDPLTEKRALMASRLAEQAKAMTFDEC